MRRARVPKSRIDLLRTLPVFAGCSDKELGWADGLCDEIDVEAGEVLIREGEIGRQAFVAIEGEARVTVGDQQLANLGPGSVFGEMASWRVSHVQRPSSPNRRCACSCLAPDSSGRFCRRASLR